MKSSLRYLTLAGFLAIASVVAWFVARPALDRWGHAAGRAEDNGVTPARISRLESVLAHNIHADDSGDRQLLLAISNLETHSSIRTDVTHDATVGNNLVSVTGEYKQQGTGTRRNVYWSLKSKLGGVDTSFKQVSDGRFLWTVRNLASGQYIDNVDLWQLRQKATSQMLPPKIPAVGEATSSQLSAQTAANFGGLPMLIESLRENFEFTAPRQFRMPDGTEVIGLIGRWQPEALAAMLIPPRKRKSEEPAGADVVEVMTAAGLREALKNYLQEYPLPERVPHHVLVLLGRDDLFPRHIEYRSARDPLSDPQLAESELFQFSTRPLARLKFDRIVFGAPIDTRDFIFPPPETPQWRDKTSNYQRRIERMQQLRTALESERRMANTPGEPAR